MSNFQFWSSMAERREEKRKETDLRCQTRCSPQAAGRMSTTGQEARKSKWACKLSCSPAPSKASWTWQGCRSWVSWMTGETKKNQNHNKKNTGKADSRQRHQEHWEDYICQVTWKQSMTPTTRQRPRKVFEVGRSLSPSLALSLSFWGQFSPCFVIRSCAHVSGYKWTNAWVDGPKPGMALTVKRQGTTSCPLVHDRVPWLKGPWKWLRVDGELCHGLHTY